MNLSLVEQIAEKLYWAEPDAEDDQECRCCCCTGECRRGYDDEEGS